MEFGFKPLSTPHYGIEDSLDDETRSESISDNIIESDGEQMQTCSQATFKLVKKTTGHK